MEQIDNLTAQILGSATITENTVALNCGQLDRKVYEAVNEVLVRLGGKWNSRKKVHIFPDGLSELLIKAVLETGEMPPKNPLAFFPTPEKVVDDMIKWADIHYLTNGWGGEEEVRFLEPSAGTGAIVTGLREYGIISPIDIVEMSPINANILRRKGFDVHEMSFLDFRGGPYRYILMNPPFSVEGDKDAWITHLLHAWGMLDNGGRLIGIAPNGISFKTDKKTLQIRKLIAEFGEMEEIGAGAFKESGTGINTVMIRLDKEAPWKHKPHNGYPSWWVYNIFLWADNGCDYKLYDRKQKLVNDFVAGKYELDVLGLPQEKGQQAIQGHFTEVLEEMKKAGDCTVMDEQIWNDVYAEFMEDVREEQAYVAA